ncbi:MAG: hypothetical protein J6C46_11850 [Clostridia bacterium]|nr:hypothetical protein [Clostridia bacterium]
MSDNTDLIDRYLVGELSVEEKQDFERLLFDDSDSLESKKLKGEMELQKEIILAIQARGLKENLRLKEEQIRFKRRKERRNIKIFGLSSFSFVAAAVILWAIFVLPIAHNMANLSIQYADQIQIESFRGGISNDYQQQLILAYTNIAGKKFDEAQIIVLSIMDDIDSVGLIEENKDFYDQAQWLNAICEMNSGHVFRAKKMLNQIANSDSFYATQAQDMLDKLKR